MTFAYAQRAYTKTMVSSSTSPLDLVIMLYDGAIESLQRSIVYIHNKDITGKVESLSKARAIIEELLSSLNKEVGGEIAENLESLYLFMLIELTKANANNDVKRIELVKELLIELRSAWRAIR